MLLLLLRYSRIYPSWSNYCTFLNATVNCLKEFIVIQLGGFESEIQGHRGILSPAIGGAIQGYIHASLHNLHG